eukprot:scaffold13466_cov103-Isochrysis_galbana.AAC.2
MPSARSVSPRNPGLRREWVLASSRSLRADHRQAGTVPSGPVLARIGAAKGVHRSDRRRSQALVPPQAGRIRRLVRAKRG